MVTVVLLACHSHIAIVLLIVDVRACVCVCVCVLARDCGREWVLSGLRFLFAQPLQCVGVGSGVWWHWWGGLGTWSSKVTEKLSWDS